MAWLLLISLAAGLLIGCGVQPEPASQDVAHGRAEVVAPSQPGPACLAAGFPTTWDATIRQAERRYLPASWVRAAPCGLRAQLAAESGLNDAWCHRANPQGTSAACLGQITAAAAADVERRAGIVGSRTSPQASIRAAAWYLAAQRAHWKAPRPTSCRRVLSVASYHAGAGTLIEAQRAARGAGHVARCYDGMKAYLPRHGPENRHYVARVAELRERMAP